MPDKPEDTVCRYMSCPVKKHLRKQLADYESGKILTRPMFHAANAYEEAISKLNKLLEDNTNLQIHTLKLEQTVMLAEMVVTHFTNKYPTDDDDEKELDFYYMARENLYSK